MAYIFPGATQILTTGFYARTKPNPSLVFSVVHTTANANLSAEGHARIQPIGSGQVTATFWVNRDGSVVQSLSDPLLMAPWTNGVSDRPDMSNPRIAACINAGVNPNRRSLVTIENVSLEPGSPITAAQKAACGRIIAWAHALAGVPITRETVIGHYQINSVNKPNCPSTNKAILNDIVALANGATQGDPDVNITSKTYPWPRTWYTKGGSLTGYILGPDPNITMSFAAGSSAPSSAEVSINPLPADWGWPAGPYQLVSDGPLKGCLVANSQVTLGPEPLPLDGPPEPSTDCTVEVAEATAALEAELTVARTALATEKSHVATLKALIRDHNAVEGKMKAVDG